MKVISKKKIGILTLLIILSFTLVLILSITIANMTMNMTLSSYVRTPANLDSIYSIAETPRITGLNITSTGVLDVRFSPSLSSNHWKIIPDGGDPYIIKKTYPQIKLLSDTHTYGIVPVNNDNESDNITLRIQYVPARRYTDANLSRGDAYHLIWASIPVGDSEVYSLDDWAGYVDNDPDILKAREILDFNNLIDDNFTTLEKIEAVSKFLLDRLDTKRGIPSGKMQNRPPLQMYEYAINNVSGIWCSNFAKIYNLFANAAGIKTRRIVVAGNLDAVSLSGHCFAESYIPEQNRWAFVDLAYKKLYIYNDKEGMVLNTIDLFHVIHMDHYNGLNSVIYTGGDIVNINYENVSDSERYYFSKSAVFTFVSPNKPDLTYSYSGNM